VCDINSISSSIFVLLSLLESLRNNVFNLLIVSLLTCSLDCFSFIFIFIFIALRAYCECFAHLPPPVTSSCHLQLSSPPFSSRLVHPPVTSSSHLLFISHVLTPLSTFLVGVDCYVMLGRGLGDTPNLSEAAFHGARSLHLFLFSVFYSLFSILCFLYSIFYSLFSILCFLFSIFYSLFFILFSLFFGALFHLFSRVFVRTDMIDCLSHNWYH
jgi:hypothetical protein